MCQRRQAEGVADPAQYQLECSRFLGFAGRNAREISKSQGGQWDGRNQFRRLADYQMRHTLKVAASIGHVTPNTQFLTANTLHLRSPLAVRRTLG